MERKVYENFNYNSSQFLENTAVALFFTSKGNVMISEWSAHALIADVVIAVAESFKNTALSYGQQL
jgi:hypothetical protein